MVFVAAAVLIGVDAAFYAGGYGAACICVDVTVEESVNEDLGCCLWDTDWWCMFRHDPQHTGYSTCDAPDTSSLAWSYHTGSGVSSSPAVVDGKVYVGSDDGKVYCLDAENGSEIWNHTIGDWVASSPAVANGKVYIGSCNWEVYCLDAENGTEIWNYTTGEMVLSSPSVADGRVYMGSHCNVYCFGDPKLEIKKVIADRGRVSVTVENTGYSTAKNVSCNLTIKGGILRHIDTRVEEFFDEVKPGENLSISNVKPVFGVGWININVTVDADNTESVSKQIKGFILGLFIYSCG